MDKQTSICIYIYLWHNSVGDDVSAGWSDDESHCRLAASYDCAAWLLSCPAAAEVLIHPPLSSIILAKCAITQRDVHSTAARGQQRINVDGVLISRTDGHVTKESFACVYKSYMWYGAGKGKPLNGKHHRRVMHTLPFSIIHAAPWEYIAAIKGCRSCLSTQRGAKFSTTFKEITQS